MADGINKHSGAIETPGLFPDKGKELSENPEKIKEVMHTLRGVFRGKNYGGLDYKGSSTAFFMCVIF